MKTLYKDLYIDRLGDLDIIKKLAITKYAFMMRRTRLNKNVKLITQEYIDNIDI